MCIDFAQHTVRKHTTTRGRSRSPYLMSIWNSCAQNNFDQFKTGLFEVDIKYGDRYPHTRSNALGRRRRCRRRSRFRFDALWGFEVAACFSADVEETSAFDTAEDMADGKVQIHEDEVFLGVGVLWPK